MNLGGKVSFKRIKPGVLDEIARDIGAKCDKDLAQFLGITPRDLEDIRYGEGLNLLQAADILRRREAHIRAAELLDPTAA